MKVDVGKSVEVEACGSLKADVDVSAGVELGLHEQAELYTDGSRPHAPVAREGNPVVAVFFPCVYASQNEDAVAN